MHSHKNVTAFLPCKIECDNLIFKIFNQKGRKRRDYLNDNFHDKNVRVSECMQCKCILTFFVSFDVQLNEQAAEKKVIRATVDCMQCNINWRTIWKLTECETKQKLLVNLFRKKWTENASRGITNTKHETNCRKKFISISIIDVYSRGKYVAINHELNLNGGIRFTLIWSIREKNNKQNTVAK